MVETSPSLPQKLFDGYQGPGPLQPSSYTAFGQDTVKSLEPEVRAAHRAQASGTFEDDLDLSAIRRGDDGLYRFPVNPEDFINGDDSNNLLEPFTSPIQTVPGTTGTVPNGLEVPTSTARHVFNMIVPPIASTPEFHTNVSSIALVHPSSPPRTMSVASKDESGERAPSMSTVGTSNLVSPPTASHMPKVADISTTLKPVQDYDFSDGEGDWAAAAMPITSPHSRPSAAISPFVTADPHSPRNQASILPFISARAEILEVGSGSLSPSSLPIIAADPPQTTFGSVPLLTATPPTPTSLATTVNPSVFAPHQLSAPPFVSGLLAMKPLASEVGNKKRVRIEEEPVVAGTWSGHSPKRGRRKGAKSEGTTSEPTVRSGRRVVLSEKARQANEEKQKPKPKSKAAQRNGPGGRRKKAVNA